MTPAELRDPILAHLGRFPATAFTAYDFKRALKLEASITLIRKTMTMLADEGLVATIVEPANDGDPRPCTRWKKAA